MYKRVLLTTVLTFAFSVAASVSGTNSFDGKWLLDTKANNTATVPPPAGLQQTIKAKGNDINIESRFKEPANAITPLLYLGIMVTNLKMNADGSEAVNQVGPFMQTTKTTIDGNKMETEWVARHTSGEVVNGHWTRTVSDDGKHMTLEIKESSSQGQSGAATLNFMRK